MTDSNSNNSGGINILGLLGVVFITLKLTGVIDWSWWYVTMPLWGGLALVFAILAIYFVGTLIYKYIKGN